MRNYIILNGKNSNEINGLLIQELPPISKPLIRTEVEEIDGRDGDIVTPLGYSAYDKEFTIGLYKDFDVNEVAAYFNSEGTVIFSNELDKYYYYQITAQIDFERLVRYRTATVTMHCQPFKYSATEQPITEDVSGTVSDEGTNLALENTAEAPFNTLDLKGNTSQQTYTGKNLLKMPIVSDSSNGITWTVQDDGSIILNGTSTAGVSIRANNVAIPAVEGETYTLSATGMGEAYNFGYKNAGSGANIFVVTSASPTTTAVVTSTMLSQANRLDMYIQSGKTFNNQRVTLQLEKGSSATPFEPYTNGPAPNPDYPQAVNTVTGENVVKICGKNLWGAEKHGNLDENTGQEVANNNRWVTDGYIPVKSNTAYTLSSDAENLWYIFCFYDANQNFISGVSYYGHSQTQTTPANCKFVKCVICDTATIKTTQRQLEEGSTATAYEPYQGQSYPVSLGSLEFCAIGNYVDKPAKIGDKWYKHKAIDKIIQDGSVQVNYYDAPSVAIANDSLTAYFSVYGYGNYVNGIDYKSNMFGTPYERASAIWGSASSPASAYRYEGMVKDGSALRVRILKSRLTGWSDSLSATDKANLMKTWLNNNTPIVYGALATPVEEEITNEALIAQLDDIYYHAHAYKGRTHITSSAATGNVPHIIAAEVGEDNESTITNAGNYLSKPKITVYGSGDISLYINDMHVLQITLGDEGYITIDTAQMEAYKDTLDNLKNRLVIGDYSNARLKPGANKIHFTGTVTKYVVENYSRWL